MDINALEAKALAATQYTKINHCGEHTGDEIDAANPVVIAELISRLREAESRLSIKRCVSCRFRKHPIPGLGGRPFCTNEKLTEYGNFDDVALDDMLIYPYNEGCYFEVGPNFGCVHHDEIVSK